VRGRGRGGRKSETIISIPTDILETKPSNSNSPIAGKKKKEVTAIKVCTVYLNILA